MAKEGDILERLIDFAASVVRLTEHLSNSSAGKHVGGLLLHSGTSSAFDYAEARGADGTKDFTHKLDLVLKDLNETGIALEIVKRSDMISSNAVVPVQQECKDLSRIIGSSLKTMEKGK